MRIRPLALSLAAVVLSMTIASVSAYPAASGRYYGGLPTRSAGLIPQSGPSYTMPDHPNLGGMWSAVPAGTSHADVSVVDDVRNTVGFDLLFVIDEYGPTVLSNAYCGSANSIPVPDGTKALYVRVIDAVSLRCSPRGLPTSGDITLAFH